MASTISTIKHLPLSSKIRVSQRRSQYRICAATRDVTADFLGTVAAIALKARLQSYQTVQVDMNCSAWDLAQGRVNSVRIEGKQWRSPQGLTAQLLEVKLNNAIIDYGALLFQQRIALQNIPVGTARVVFNQDDFGNFLNHPLMKAAAKNAVQGRPFYFDSKSVLLDAFFGPCGSLTLEGTSSRDQQRYQVGLMPADCIPVLKAGGNNGGQGHQRTALRQQAQPLQVVATRMTKDGPVRDAAADVVGFEIMHFFTDLLIDLQGAELMYHSMTVTRSNRAEESDLLQLDLKVRIRDFPPLNVQF